MTRIWLCWKWVDSFSLCQEASKLLIESLQAADFNQLFLNFDWVLTQQNLSPIQLSSDFSDFFTFELVSFKNVDVIGKKSSVISYYCRGHVKNDAGKI